MALIGEIEGVGDIDRRVTASEKMSGSVQPNRLSVCAGRDTGETLEPTYSCLPPDKRLTGQNDVKVRRNRPRLADPDLPPLSDQ